jgi:formiminoglutamate deiminase
MTKSSEDAMHSLHVGKALTPEGWKRNVRLVWTAGVFAQVEAGVAPLLGEPRATLAVPGLANLHSHAFQRAFAGLTERRGASADNFWSWREQMYRYALAIEPNEVAAIAAQAYVEMLEAGFTRVGEFHYLHHAPDGRAYDDIGELSTRIAEAAQATGIGLTLLPVFYAHSGFGGAPPNESQRRFINDLESFARLFERCESLVSALDGANLGLAPHSLRAATPEEINRLVELARGRPLHIHVAEQTAEVDASRAALGARPVEFLLDRFPVAANWCGVHATHMTPEETRRLVASGAVAGLCPITEANLGDGLFPAREFLDAGGAFGVGTDSNVRISLAEELRTLEYGQRLTRRERNVFAASGGSTARALFEGAARGGAQALGRVASGFVVDADADIVTFREDDFVEDDDDALSLWIFAAAAPIDQVYARGRRVVEDGQHISRRPIADRFRGALRDLRTRAPTKRA